MSRMPVQIRGALATAAFVSGVAFAAASPARAADDGYANVFSSLFSAVGVIKPDPAPDIAYRERPPLVLPPQPGLPKPVSGGIRSAAWPNDPDVLRHRKESDEALAPRTSQSTGLGRDDRVSAAELLQGRGQSDGGGGPHECNTNRDNRSCLMMTPDELKAESERYAADNPSGAEQLVPGQEPERVYLTQPPKGYLKSTRVVKATSEAPEERIDEANPRAVRLKRDTDE